MLDKLLVADPNHEPRFFASANFAADNSPITFLTSHMSDTIMTITDMRPSKVEATGFRQKLKSLEPVPSDGYDTVDTTIRFTSGAVCHVVTGWTLPNTANTLTVQRGRLLYTDGMLDLWNESYGYHEVSPNGIADRNVLFMNRNPDETYSGYGIDNPGRILTEIVSLRGNEQPPTKFDPVSSGVLATLVCECATASLARGNEVADGVVAGEEIDARDYLVEQIGPDSAGIYL
jgi:predicted dehydrogenase